MLVIIQCHVVVRPSFLVDGQEDRQIFFVGSYFVVQEKCGWEAWAALQVQVTINTEHGGKPIIFLISFRTGTKLHSLLQELQVLKEEYRWQSGRKRPEV